MVFIPLLVSMHPQWMNELQLVACEPLFACVGFIGFMCASKAKKAKKGQCLLQFFSCDKPRHM